MTNPALKKNHWTSRVNECSVGKDTRGDLNVSLRGGAENGEFAYIGQINENLVFYRDGKLNEGELLLEVENLSISGLPLYDVETLIKNCKSPVKLKTVRPGTKLNKDLKHYLSQRFQKSSPDHELQQTIRENLYRHAVPCSTKGKRQKKIFCRTQNYLNLYAADGLRTLCIAKKTLSKEEYARWLQRHLEAETAIQGREELLFESALRLETNLHLLGATGIEDRLQDGVPETIATLRKAGLQIWVLTGDKQETAVNIAYACKLLDPDEEIITLNADSQEECAVLLEESLRYIQSKFLCNSGDPSTKTFPSNIEHFEIYPSSSLSSTQTTHFMVHRLGLVIDGRTLAYALDKTLEDKFLAVARSCRSVLCCRSTPLQKSMVVKLVRNKLKVMTLAIGDGANDVSMIQVADVGVGISGQEGMQAVMASDFALPRFRYLQKLLLVHGHWCYSRLANMILYFFYKNAMFVAIIFWYQFYCGFSGSAMIDQWYLIFFNLMFSAFPQLITGTLDKDVSKETLQQLPQLYMSGQNSEEYKPYMFWMNMMDAFYQSLVCFFIPYFAYADSDVDLFTWGTPITTIALFTILLHLGIETKTWTWMNWLSIAFSVALFFTAALFYNASCPTCYSPSNSYWTIQRLLQDPLFYLLCLITPVSALLPRYFYRACQGTLCPSPTQAGRQLDKLPSDTRRSILSLSRFKMGSLLGAGANFLSLGKPKVSQTSTPASGRDKQSAVTQTQKEKGQKIPPELPRSHAPPHSPRLPGKPKPHPAKRLDETLPPSGPSSPGRTASVPLVTQMVSIHLNLPPDGASQCVMYTRSSEGGLASGRVAEATHRTVPAAERAPHTSL